MLTRRNVLALAASGLPLAARTVPEDYAHVWSDEFHSLSLRTGGPTDLGLQSGHGVWSAPGTWWSNDPKGVQGYAYDWLVNPSYHWPGDYGGPFSITQDGLRIRSQVAPQIVSAILPKLNLAKDALDGRDVTPWLSAQINSWHGVRIAPPFYFECKAKMPRGVGRPWPAIWLMSGDRGQSHRTSGREYEIDLHEGFGDSDKLHCTLHWHATADTKDYLARGFERSCPDLSVGFSIWGCHVTAERQIFYFNGDEVWRFDTPPGANANQPYGIILDVTAGIPWKTGGPPSDSPHDMIVRYVRLYAPNKQGLRLAI
jgi:hypothetical protein